MSQRAGLQADHVLQCDLNVALWERIALPMAGSTVHPLCPCQRKVVRSGGDCGEGQRDIPLGAYME